VLMETLGIGRQSFDRESDRIEYVTIHRPLHRVLAFTRRSIDDVVNSRIVKNEVAGYYKLHCWVNRESEKVELERQWNGVKSL
jgi:hypothetical protein